MKCCNLLCFMKCLSLGLIASSDASSEDKPGARLDVFSKISDGESAGNRTLSLQGLQRFVNTLTEKLECAYSNKHGNSGDHEAVTECRRFMCVNATTLVAPTPRDVISKEQFENVCIILLDLITSAERLDLCHKVIDTSSVTVEKSRTNLLTSIMGFGVGETNGPHLSVSGLLDTLNRSIESKQNENAYPVNALGGNSMNYVQREGSGESLDNNIDGTVNSNREPLLEKASALVLEQKCLSKDSLKYYMGSGEQEDFAVSSLPQLASLVAYLVYDGSDVKDRCRVIPDPELLASAILNRYGGQGKSIDVSGMKSLMTKMGIGQDRANMEGGHNDKHRNKQSLQTQPAYHISGKQEASVYDPLKTCYSAEQLMAVHDSPLSVDEATFHQICPSLVSQSLFADCSSQEVEDGNTSKMSTAEKYGYGSVAIFFICASSFVGMLFLPCVSKGVYNVLMSTFVGLAMGSLYADSVLHLFPMALGAHGHGEGHGHEAGDIKIEDHVQIGLCIMACLYGFYLLEVFISKFGGHSCQYHSKTGSEDSSLMDILNDNNTKPGYDFVATDSDAASDEKSSGSSGIFTDITSLPPVALMVVLGDAVHNFADGLAVAAAFSTSITSGVATSIAIFCHELPHELGDFAVLLQSGCSFKKAALLNLVSALTAFIGLYVGIQVATSEHTQRFIFAAAASMFMYIALVDLLPMIIKTKSNFHIMLNNIGIMIGYAILFLIAVFEEHISF